MSESIRQLAAIMFTDIVGYTALMGKDEFRAFQLLDKNRSIQKPLINQHNGHLIKEIGDGMLASFNSALDAVECATEIQHALNDDQELNLRLGIHLGDITFKDGDVFGDGVNIASRIQELAKPGDILVSESVYKNIKNHPDIDVKFLREEKLKNVEDPVRIYHVQVGVANAGTDFSGPEDAEMRRNKWVTKNRRKLMFGVVMIALVGIAGWWYFQLNPSFESAEKYPLGDSRVAILPFENNTNDPNLEVFGDMAADWIIQGLMSFDDVKVVSFETVQDHLVLASVGNLGSFADRTGADKIVRGSYYLQGNEVIVQSQLIDVLSGEIELALPEVRGHTQDVEKIVVELRDRLLTVFIAESDVASELLRYDPPPYDAYKYFKKAQEFFGKDMDESRKMLRRAIQLDSGFYFAYFIAQQTYTLEGNLPAADSVFKLVDKMENLSHYGKLWRDVFKALKARSSQDQYDALKILFEKDPRQMLTNYWMGLMASDLNKPKEVIEYYEYIKPANIAYDVFWETWWNNVYGHNLIRLGRYEEALGVLSYVPDELTGTWYYSVLLTAYVFNRDDNMLDPILKKMESENFSREDVTYRYIVICKAYLLINDLDKHWEWSQRTLKRIEDAGEDANAIIQATGYYFSGDYHNAIDLLKIANRVKPLNWFYQARLGAALAKLERNDDAMAIIATLQETISPETNGNPEYGMATIYSALGQKDEAVKWLEQAFDAGRGFLYFGRYDLDPEFLPLHGYAPYEEFVWPKE